ncbi:MAG: carboxypeptidase-like regulatory domain-containing protein [Flavobacteriales bacterium]
MKNLLLFFFAFVALQMQAQLTQTVRGQIIDKNSKSPIAGATVKVENSDPEIATATDDKGFFRLEKVPVGRQTISIFSIAHHPIFLENQEVKSGKELYLEIEMDEKVTTVNEIKISAKKNNKAENEMITTSNVSMSPKQTERFAGSLSDVSRMAMNYAGVISASDNRNDIIIRGNSPAGILWRLNGINIPNPNHFGSLGSTGGPITILNNNNLAKSDFMTGAFPADYGNALAGAFDLKLRHGNNEKFEGTGMFGFNGVELGVEGPFSKKSKASYMANYRYSTLGIFDAVGISFGVAAIPQYQDLTFNIDIPMNKKYGKLEMFGVGGYSTISILADKAQKEGDVSYTQQGTNNYLISQMGVSGIGHTYYFNEKTHMKSVFAVSGISQTVHSDSLDKDYQNPGLIYDNKTAEIKYSFNWYVNTKFNSRNTWKSGVIVDLYDVRYYEKFRSNYQWFTGYDFSGNTYLLQAYSQWKHKFSDKIRANIGAHYQQLTLNNSYAIEPRGGISWDVAKNKTISLGAGMHSQIQPFSVYLLETTVGNSMVRTNQNLDLSRSNHMVLGYNHSFNQHMRVKVESYYQQVSGIPVLNNSYFSLANFGSDFTFPRADSLENRGTGKNVGIELTVERNFHKGYYFLFSGSLYDSKYVGGDGVEHSTAFNGNYAANILGGAEFNLTKKVVLQIDAKITYAGGKRYIPIDLAKSQLAGKAVFDENDIFNQQFHDYFRADLKAGIRINSKKITQEISFNVQNILDTKNVFQQIYDNVNKDVKTEYQLGFFPVGSYKIMF